MKTSRPRFLATTALALTSILLSGCLIRTTVQDEPRQQIHFSSAPAAQVFYDAYLAINHPSPQNNHGCVYIPLPYRHSTVSTDNVRFNAAIRSADSDQDGIISESEAGTYVKKVKKPST